MTICLLKDLIKQYFWCLKVLNLKMEVRSLKAKVQIKQLSNKKKMITQLLDLSLKRVEVAQEKDNHWVEKSIKRTKLYLTLLVLTLLIWKKLEAKHPLKHLKNFKKKYLNKRNQSYQNDILFKN